ncbi:MAG: NAD(P)-dependent oxidoreductase [Candidatus Melainabacteria bacterium]|nr:NAD(P)-dependent oxidoreductase [Candidatus Melainabacteria bacterium]
MVTVVKREQKILRILRLRVLDKPGYLGRIATRLGELEVNIGDVSIAGQGPDYLIRELSVQLKDEAHLQRVIESVTNNLDGVTVEGVIDPVEQAHRGGKIGMKSRAPLDTIAEMRKIYTPGVAQICKLIHKDASQSRIFTTIGNSVAVVTNGTAILGLGNIGPVAGMPVMEGKAVLYEQLVGISAIPILIESRSVEDVVNIVKGIASTFGAIHLEDIAAPECFEIEKRLEAELSIPVLHDDQHATAAVVLGALITISQRSGFHLENCRVGILGLGAAGAGIAQLLLSYGVKEILGADLRDDAMTRLKASGGTPANLDTVMRDSDIVIATTGVPGLIKPEAIRKDQIILAISNPDPEIDPELAIASGAKFAADGRTINNALAFPGLFKGALAAEARYFTSKMKIAAAQAIAGQTKLDDLVPSILDRGVHDHVANAVAIAANE